MKILIRIIRLLAAFLFGFSAVFVGVYAIFHYLLFGNDILSPYCVNALEFIFPDED